MSGRTKRAVKREGHTDVTARLCALIRDFMAAEEVIARNSFSRWDGASCSFFNDDVWRAADVIRGR